MFENIKNIPWHNQGCGVCFRATWDHPNTKCEKFVNDPIHWEAAKVSNEFDPRQAGTNVSST